MKLTYRKIRSNDYTKIPDFVSPEANELITNILKNDPIKRLSIEEILCHDWICASAVPKLLSGSTISVPPSSNYKEMYAIGNVKPENMVPKPTLRAKAQTAAAGSKREKKDDLVDADGAPLKAGDDKTDRKEA